MNKLEKLKEFLDIMGITYFDSRSNAVQVGDNMIVLKFMGDFFGGRDHMEFFEYDPDSDELLAVCNIGGFDEMPTTLYSLANMINVKYNHKVKATTGKSKSLTVHVQIRHEDPKSCYLGASDFLKSLTKDIEEFL